MRPIQVTNSAMDRASVSLTRYHKEINKVRCLTAEEENKLMKEYRAGKLCAFEKIINANLRFVISIARHYQYQGISLPDLISEGNIGLLKAVEQYDETRGFKFISYAVWWIRQSIIRALNEHSRIIRLPRNKVVSLHKLTQIFKQLEQEFEREPTFEELSNLSGVEPEVIKTILRYVVKQVSIDAPLEVDEVKSLLDVIEDTNAELPDNRITNSESLETVIRFSLTALNQNQSTVVKMYYGLEGEEQMNYREISQKLNVSTERIRQIKEAALIRIKKSNHYQKLEEHLG